MSSITLRQSKPTVGNWERRSAHDRNCVSVFCPLHLSHCAQLTVRHPSPPPRDADARTRQPWVMTEFPSGRFIPSGDQRKIALHYSATKVKYDCISVKKPPPTCLVVCRPRIYNKLAPLERPSVTPFQKQVNPLLSRQSLLAS